MKFAEMPTSEECGGETPQIPPRDVSKWYIYGGVMFIISFLKFGHGIEISILVPGIQVWH